MRKNISQVGLIFGLAEYINVFDCLRRSWVTEGKYTKQVNSILSSFYTGESFLVPNGTLAIYLALCALDLPPDSNIVVPNLTFYGSASPSQFLGLNLRFADVSPLSFNSTFEQIKNSIDSHTSCVVIVGLFGSFEDLDLIYTYCNERGIKVLIDAAQALFVNYKQKSILHFCDLAITSFFADKVVGCGEGGAIFTRNSLLASRIRLYRNQGRPNSGTFLHPSLGMNFRITDLQSAVLLPRLKRFSKIISRRLDLICLYKTLLSPDSRFSFLQRNEFSDFSPFRFVLILNQIDLAEFSTYLSSKGIQVRSNFIPLSEQPHFKSYSELTLTPNSSFCSRNAICLPIHERLTKSDVRYIASICLSF